MSKNQRKKDAGPDYNNLGVFSKMPCGYILTEPNGEILYVNDFLCEWLGYEKHEIDELKTFQNLLTPGSNLFYETKHSSLVKIQKTVYEINYKFICKDGTRLDVLVNSALLEDDDNETFGIQHVVFPFSDRKKYESQLIEARKKAEKSSEAKSNFLSTITHEIRTPIHSVLGISDMLIQENPRQDQLEMLQSLQMSSLNLLELINSILEYNKIEAGKLVLVESPLDIHQMLTNLVKMFQPQAKFKDINLSLMISDDTPRYYIGDAIKIKQVLTNLLSNSLKFTSNGNISISLESRDDLLDKRYLKFKVEDSGIGMTEEEMSAIFDPFTQANESIHRNFGGTGMGLSITQKILQAYDSKLEVESIKDEGSIFEFALRLRVCDPPERLKKAIGGSNQEKLTGLRVLVVDDSPSNHFIVKSLLTKWDVTFHLVNSGKEALETINEKVFDVVLMDLSMPGMDGFETTKRIRSLDDNENKLTPIIAYSAAVSAKITDKMKDVGMNDLILKPFRAEKLYSLIKQYGEIAITNQDEEKDIRSSNSETLINPKLDKVEEIFNHESETVKKYLEAVINDVKNLQQKLSKFQSNSNFDVVTFEAISHSTKTISRLFELYPLTSLFNEGKLQLKEGQREQFLTTLETIIAEVNNFSTWINKKLNS